MSVAEKQKEIIGKGDIRKYLFRDDGIFPNNKNLPLLVYRHALRLPTRWVSYRIRKIFDENNWMHSWKNGIYDFHHYHSTAHEVLGIAKGYVTVLFGGVSGTSVFLQAGDVVIIPAGVAHMNESSSADFACVGAYPDGTDYDMNYGKIGERPKADDAIRKLALPSCDPVYGEDGPLRKLWKL